MRGMILLTLIAGPLLSSGCQHLKKKHEQQPPPVIEVPTFSQFHQPDFTWRSVARVLVLPLLNESEYNKAADEVGQALATELQTMGRFEVVAAPPDVRARLAAEIHRNGRFNEAVMLDVARTARADIIVHGTITQYSPYPRPRLGLILQAVSPFDGKVIASVDGVWDSTRLDVAERIRGYYRMNPHKHPWIVNHTIPPDDSFSGELALDSPYLFQRYVCAEASINLVKDASAVMRGLLERQAEQAMNCGDGSIKQKRPPIGW